MGKLLEGLVTKRLNKGLGEKNNLLNNQFGLRNGHKTTQEIKKVIEKAREKMTKTYNQN